MPPPRKQQLHTGGPVEDTCLKVLAAFKLWGVSQPSIKNLCPFFGSSVGMETPDNLWLYGLSRWY